MFYSSTNHAASSTLSSTRLAFEGRDCIAVNKVTQIQLLSPDGSIISNIPLNARIAFLASVSLNPHTPALLVATTKHKWAVLKINADSKTPSTAVRGSFYQSLSTPAANGILAASFGSSDTGLFTAAIHAYLGVIHFVQFDGSVLATHPSSPLKKQKRNATVETSIRVKELNILQVEFIKPGKDRRYPLVGILHQDAKKARFITVYQLDFPNAQLLPVSPNASHLDRGWSRPLSVHPDSSSFSSPSGSGILTFSHTLVSYYVNGACVFNVAAPAPLTGVCEQIQSFRDADGDEDMGVDSAVKNEDVSGRFQLLVGDSNAKIHLLTYPGSGEEGVLSSIGTASAATSITMTSPTTVYIGSHSGDSYMADIDLNSQSLSVKETYSNLAPMIDFVHIESGGSGQTGAAGQGKIVACCGYGVDGSLRVMRNGVGVVDVAEIEDIEGVQGIWAGSASLDAKTDDMLVLSFIGETKVLCMDQDGDLAEWDLDENPSDVILEETTLNFGNTVHRQLVQITGSRIVLLDSATKRLRDTWTTPAGSRIVKSGFNTHQVVVALTGNVVVYFEVQDGALISKGQLETDHEVSCIDLANIASSDRKDGHLAQFIVAGMWNDGSVRVFHTSTFQQVSKEVLGGDLFPRSVKVAKLSGIQYLMVGLGDGQLISFTVETCNNVGLSLSNRKKFTLGTQPLNLVSFKSNGVEHVFAASDLPAVVYVETNQKLMCSNLNLKSVSAVCQFRLPETPNGLAIATLNSLKIASLDNINKANHKLHVQKFALNETPRRIMHLESSGALVVLTGQGNAESHAGEDSLVRVFNDQTFECSDHFSLPMNEAALGICKLSLSLDGSGIARANISSSIRHFVAVGTAKIDSIKDDPKFGRILVFALDPTSKKLALVTSYDTKGPAYSVASLGDGLIAATFGSKVQVLQLSYNEETNTFNMAPLCTQFGLIQAVYLSVRDNILVVGDIIRSVFLLEFFPATGESPAKLAITGRDGMFEWNTCVATCPTNSRLFLAGENNCNLYALRKQDETQQLQDERMRLDLVGAYHLGETVNAVKPGTLAMNSASGAVVANSNVAMSGVSGEGNEVNTLNEIRASSLLYCTANGSVGTLLALDASRFRVLSGLQQNLESHLPAVGEFSHAEWRTYQSEKRTQESTGFIDGDFVQQFANLSEVEMRAVFEGARNGGVAVESESVEAVLGILEELALLS
ncbi:CPSF A subunit region-domain-containing protein [Chytriomyces cf. hyalinus JEL632]|nr:CPSF A subunit region-domain-containing protein [Chytriomyces cf. hyalinus JEL632]